MISVVVFVIAVIIIIATQCRTQQTTTERETKVRFDETVKIHHLPMTREDIEARRSIRPSLPDVDPNGMFSIPELYES